ncbi:MAG: hypothetical protein H0V29_07980 [Thermoleophilaceae bacterium]|nr:hypothetical protein [Thermoleophilaceae bacterium]
MTHFGKGLIAILAALALLGFGGCGNERESSEPPDPALESADRPAKPPAGWRTVRNRSAGLSVSVPPGWGSRVSGAATLLRSPDRLMAVSLAADRSSAGRELSAKTYARRTVAALPAYKGRSIRSLGRVRRSQYQSAVAQGRARSKPERVRVAAFRKRRRVTYAAVAFSNSRVAPRINDGTLARIFASLRGRPPRP